jgi:hypothetical protein
MEWCRVIHPLDDAPEVKVNVGHLGPMLLTRSVRWSLIALRAYLVLMIGLMFMKVVMFTRA